MPFAHRFLNALFMQDRRGLSALLHTAPLSSTNNRKVACMSICLCAHHGVHLEHSLTYNHLVNVEQIMSSPSPSPHPPSKLHKTNERNVPDLKNRWHTRRSTCVESAVSSTPHATLDFSSTSWRNFFKQISYFSRMFFLNWLVWRKNKTESHIFVQSACTSALRQRWTWRCMHAYTYLAIQCNHQEVWIIDHLGRGTTHTGFFCNHTTTTLEDWNLSTHEQQQQQKGAKTMEHTGRQHSTN